MRTLSGLIDPVETVDPDGQPSFDYVNAPTFWQEITFDWKYGSFLDRLTCGLRAIVILPILFIVGILTLPLALL